MKKSELARFTTTKPAIPPVEVLDFFESKKLRPAFSWVDVWKEEHVAAFTVAGLLEQDMLGDMQAAIDKSLREGLPFEEFQKRTSQILADKGWLGRKTVVDPITGDEKDVELGAPWRLAVIFDTNLRTARAAGQWSRITRASKVMPYLEYRLGPSKEHRPEHEAFAGMILPVDDPFWSTHFPPNGFGCKCGVRQMSRLEAKERGGPHTSPSLPMRDWKNPRTGEQIQVPYGVDPGFDFNPGLNRFGGLGGGGIVPKKISLPPKPVTVVPSAPPPPPIPPPAEPVPPAVPAPLSFEAGTRALMTHAMRTFAGTTGYKSFTADFRDELRKYFREYFRLEHTKEFLGPFANMYLVTRAASMPGAAGAHYPDGLIELNDKYVTNATRDVGGYERGTLFSDLSGISTIVHEEIHELSAMSRDKGPFGRWIEEVTTELASNQIVREMYKSMTNPDKIKESVAAEPTYVKSDDRFVSINPYSKEIATTLNDIYAHSVAVYANWSHEDVIARVGSAAMKIRDPEQVREAAAALGIELKSDGIELDSDYARLFLHFVGFDTKLPENKLFLEQKAQQWLIRR